MGADDSLHSRAARRGASPPAKDVSVAAPTEETEYKPWLHNAQSAGISKKKKAKQMTRQQKQRQLRALEKADVNVDKLEKKVADSKARGKRVQSRRKDWEELNDVLNGKGKEGGRGAPQAGEGQQKMEDAQGPDLMQPLPTHAVDEEARAIVPTQVEATFHGPEHVDEDEDEVL